MSTHYSEYTCPVPAPLPFLLTLCNGYISCARALAVLRESLPSRALLIKSKKALGYILVQARIAIHEG